MVMAGSVGIAGAGRPRCVPKRGNRPISRCPGGRDLGGDACSPFVSVRRSVAGSVATFVPFFADRRSVTDLRSASSISAVAVKGLRQRQAESTRELLVSIARERFTEQGYAATSIEDIVKRAGVAKGALYHHFSGKDALFRAVYDAVLAEAVSAVMAAALAAARTRGRAVRAGLSAFLDACLEPSFRRVVILESVSVLQHELTAEGGIGDVELPMLRTVLTPLADERRAPGRRGRRPGSRGPRRALRRRALHRPAQTPTRPEARSTACSTRWSTACARRPTRGRSRCCLR